MDVAALSLSVNSKSVVDAANDLDRFAASSAKAAAASSKVDFGKQSGSIARLVASVQAIDAKLGKIVSSLNSLAAANDNVAASARVSSAAINTISGSLSATMAPMSSVAAGAAKVSVNFNGVARAAEQADAHVRAFRASQAAAIPVLGQADDRIVSYRTNVAKAGATMRLTARDGLNLSRQFADIGVTAAMGMSPLLIALQQGPQLLDIFQEKAIVTGTTVGAAFRSALVDILAFAAPFLPLIALLAAAAAGLAALTAQANDDSGLKKYTTAMGYTKAEVEKLNAVTVTFGDTTKAVFQVGLENVADALGISTADMAQTWDNFLDHLLSATRATLAGIYAGFAGTRAYLAELEKGGLKGIGKMLIGQGDPDLLKNTYGKAYADAQSGMDAIIAQARKNAQGRQDAMAKDFYDKPSTPKVGKTDAEKLIDIYNSAKADIAIEKARGLAAANDTGAREAAKLEKQTSLLNTIQQRNIPITDAVRKKVGELAAEYADLKTDADVSEAINAATKSVQDQRDAIADQIKLIGLYGDALDRAKREQDAQRQFKASLPKGEIVVVNDLTSGLSDDIDAANRLKRAEELRKTSADAAAAMDRERAGLALTGEAALQYAFVTDKLNAARQAGIDLSPAEVAAINAAGDAYAAQRYAIDQQAQAIADAREVTKGFFTDWINGVRQGGNLFKSFTNAVINGLNKIIDKLLDKTLDGFLDKIDFGSLFGGSSNAYGIKGADNVYALGGAFGTAQRFAKGGAFTNQVVNTPTLFRFANGAALGEMGEAGPEAVMPLKRGPNGSLGVQVHGGRATTGDVNVENHYHVSGAIDQGQIVAMIQQGGKATYDQVKRDLQSLLQQLDNDGVLA